MPTVEGVRTKSASSVWRSPDGQREIFEVIFDYQGQELKAKTYSKAITQEGWSGTVETSEKEGKYGLETWVKQPQREGGYQGGGGYRGGGGGAKADPFTMYLSYAKDLAVASVTTDNNGVRSFDTKLYVDLLDAVSAGGFQLYAGRPDAPDKPAEKEQVTIEDISAALGGEPIDAGETPWPKK